MMFALTCLCPVAVFAQIVLVTHAEPQWVFAGEARQVSVVWRNAGDQMFAGEIRTRMLQTSSATVVTIGEAPWKRLQVLPGQTVLESAWLDFPLVKEETRFVVQWLDNTHLVMGKTEVLVYPTNLLAELKPLAGGDRALGVFDPGNELKPLLKAARVQFEDLEDSGIGSFGGRLAIIGPFASRQHMAGDLADRIKKLARHGTAVVWILPPADARARLMPTFYIVPAGTNVIVVAQAVLLAGLAEQPPAQLALLELCRLAMNPAPPVLPTFALQP